MKNTAISQLLKLYKGLLKFFSGFYDGLMLIVKYPYVFYLLCVASVDEIVITIMDYQFKLLGAHSTTTHSELAQQSLIDTSSVGDSTRFAKLLGNFGIVTNLISFFFAFFGFSYLVNNFKIRWAVMIFPIFLFVAVIITNLFPSLWVMFVFVSIIKSALFTLHDPVKQLLYIPTNEAIKYKAAAWIDVFGARLAKACGSFIANFANGNVHKLRMLTEIPCIILSVVFIAVSYIVGDKFEYLIKNNIIVGQSDIPTASLPQDGDTKGDSDNDYDNNGYDVDWTEDFGEINHSGDTIPCSK